MTAAATMRRPGIYNLHPSVGLPVPCPLISRCEEHSAHICCRHAFLPPSFLLSPVRVSCPERTFLKVRASEHGQAQSQHSETRRACSLFLASQSSFLFLRHFPLDKARVVQGSTRSLPTHGKAPLPSLSAEGWLARVAGALYEGRQREEGPELRSCGVLLLSLWGTSPNESKHCVALGGAACGLDWHLGAF